MKTRDVVILGAALVIAAFVLGGYFYKSKKPLKTIRVVGNASKRFGTDTVKWQLTITRNARNDAVSKEYALIGADVATLVAELKAHSIEEKSITVQPVGTMPMHDRDGMIAGYRVMQSLTIISDKVDEVERLALNPDTIVSKGIIIENSRLEYFYSKVDELKRELLGEASRDARMRAEEIAGGSGVTVGAIRDARAGVFQITEPFSTEVSGYGIYNTTSREKDIKVTVHVEFELE